MADIYLAISETPTVVTLTSAVLNSAVASSVTVVNTVTVALDANSLSALENVTVTVGAAITGTVTVSSLPAITGTVTANVPLSVDGYTLTTGVRVIGTGADGTLRIQGIEPNLPSSGANLEEGGAIPVFSLNGFPLSVNGTINGLQDGDGTTFGVDRTFPVSGTIDIASALPAGTNRIGVVTIGGGTVTIGAGTAQIGSVTASISNFPATQAVSLTTLPALVAGTAQIGSVTASLAISSTAITSGSFTSLTSATLVPGNVARKMATVYNLGAGQLFVNAGATATTLGGGFMVALSSGDYFECDYTTTTLSAIFATAGTASWVSH
jgi:hypothetical protein